MPILEKMDLRKALFQLYLKNNPKLEHQIFIYSYHGVSISFCGRCIAS
ncbi:Uncharacterised protein [Kingella kingae]|uniref:Uncharacterized protein n=1 Tax=Kingella kingae TaxID=504 RepID=A0AAX2J4Z7_KINKI|nr:Uncharacterised protein [Kingella kingae]